MADSDIETSATGPKSVSVDGQSTTEHSLPDQIAAARHAEAQAAKTSRAPGIRLFQLRNRGTV